MDQAPATDARKRELRARVRNRRARAAAQVRRDEAAGWTAQVLALVDATHARVVASYVSYGTEPPTGELVEALRRRGVAVLLPVLREDRDLDWEADGVRLDRDAIARADLVVVPALSVARDGTRLGQGGGSYDRALPRIRDGVPVVALVHEEEVVDAGALPRDPHDVAVSHVVTPRDTVVCTRRHAHPDRELPVDPDATPAFRGPAEGVHRRWDVAAVIAVGGALGALARWGLGEVWTDGEGGFPWATFVENVSGCFLLGLLVVLIVDVWPPWRYARPFVATGLLGGFTTFSTYTVDVRVLVAAGDAGLALAYLASTLLLGLLAAWFGLRSGRALAGVPQHPLRGRRDARNPT